MDQNPHPGACFLLVAAVAALLQVALPATAEDYLPLTIGNYWVYDGSCFAEHERATITGTIQLWGTDVFVNRISESTHNEGLENYFTTSEEDVNLWGFRWSDGYGMVYYPPLLVVDGPLFLGKQWTSTITIYSTPDSTILGQETWLFQVDTDEMLALPAGSFHAFGIAAGVPSPRAHPSLGGLGPGGEVLSPAHPRTPSRWWSEGIGIVQYSTSDMYQLSAYGNEPTATQMTSWGRVKALYHP